MARTAFEVGPETERILAQGHPWVLADAFTRRWPRGNDGDLIRLTNATGAVLTTALRETGGRIVARVLEGQPAKIDRLWLEDKFVRAQALRKQHLFLEQTTVYRLVNAEGDGLPGLALDRYGDFLLLHLYSPVWKPYLSLLTSVIGDVFSPRGLYVKDRPKNTRQLEKKRKSEGDYGRLVSGHPAPEPHTVEENGLRFLVDLAQGLHTGLFMDQRENRRDLMQRVQGRRVLNLFSYTGAFSVAAAAAGASRVTSVDASANAMDWARKNFALNRLNPKTNDFLVGDAFHVLQTLNESEEAFDVILMDPPAFSTTKKSRFSTKGGTAQIMARALPLLKPGGLLISSCNHQKISETDYLKELRKGMIAANNRLRVMAYRGQPEDFPYPPSWPEGRYLKYVLSVKDR